MFDGILNFMLGAGLLTHGAIKSGKSNIRFYSPENELTIISPAPGLFKAEVDVGSQVKKGQALGHLLDIYSGEMVGQAVAPESGQLVSLLRHPVVYKEEPLAVILTGEKRRWPWPFL